MRAWLALGVVISAGWFAGCSNNDPVRFRVSGEAKFEGQPIAFGDVVFTPDGSKKNSGAQGIAHIRDGKYDTALLEGKGVSGGPMVLHVTGFTAEGGKLLCEFEVQVDLPRADTTHNIEGTKKGAVKPSKSPEI